MHFISVLSDRLSDLLIVKNPFGSLTWGSCLMKSVIVRIVANFILLVCSIFRFFSRYHLSEFEKLHHVAFKMNYIYDQFK